MTMRRAAATAALLAAATAAPAQPPDAPPVEPPTPQVSALPGETVELRRDAVLRSRPKREADVLAVQASSVVVRGSVANDQGVWWYAELGGGRTAWVLEEDIIR